MRLVIGFALVFLCSSTVFGQHLIEDQCRPSVRHALKVFYRDNKIDVFFNQNRKTAIVVDGKLLSHKARVELGRYLVINVVSSPGTSIRMEEMHVFATCNDKIKEVFYCVTDSSESLPGEFRYKIDVKFENNNSIQITKHGKKPSGELINLVFNSASFAFGLPDVNRGDVMFDLFGQKVCCKNGKWDYRFD